MGAGVVIARQVPGRESTRRQRAGARGPQFALSCHCGFRHRLKALLLGRPRLAPRPEMGWPSDGPVMRSDVPSGHLGGKQSRSRLPKHNPVPSDTAPRLAAGWPRPSQLTRRRRSAIRITRLFEGAGDAYSNRNSRRRRAVVRFGSSRAESYPTRTDADAAPPLIHPQPNPPEALDARRTRSIANVRGRLHGGKRHLQSRCRGAEASVSLE